MSNTNTNIVSRNEVGFTTEMISITYSNLVNLRDNSLLVPGQKYRIIDYVTTTTQAYTRVPGSGDVDTANYEPVFDIIVEANSANTLSEIASAIQRVGNLRFANSKVESWKLRYCLDNDTNRFAWADSTNGKGVIYSMEDEFENKCGYDFKSIQFQRYKITAKTDSKKTDDLVGKYHGMMPLDQSNFFLPSGYTISSSDYKWFYTFGVDEGNDPGASKSDKSMNKNGTTSQCSSNEIEPLFGNLNNNANTHKQYLNQIVFLNDASTTSIINSKTSNNKFEGRCHTMTFGNNCYSNSFGYGCGSNSFGNDYYNNSFGNNCNSNSFGNGCSSNSFGNGYYNNSFGSYCYTNSFGNGCYTNTFGNKFRTNSFGNNCNYNSFGNECNYNSFGNNCSSNSFGNNCLSNSFGDSCGFDSYNYGFNSFGNDCSYNSFGNYCYTNTFGNNCNSNSFGNYCNSNSFGNNCSSNSFGNNCNYNSFGNNCYKYINISFSGKQIKLGFNGDSDYGFINTGDLETGKISISGTIYNNFDDDKTVHIEIEFAYKLEYDDEEYYETVSEDFLVSANSDLDFEVAFEEDGAAFNGNGFNANGIATFQVGNRTITSEGRYEGRYDY